jgi:hypothetical protein
MGFAPLPSDYILTSSNTTLESLELARMNAASNLRKELHDVVEEWVEAEVQARMARWVRQRGQLERTATNIAPPAIADSSAQSQSSPNELLLPPDALAPTSISPDPIAADPIPPDFGGRNDQPLVEHLSAKASPEFFATTRPVACPANVDRISIVKMSAAPQRSQTPQANPPPPSRRSRHPKTRNGSMTALRSLEHCTSFPSRYVDRSLDTSLHCSAFQRFSHNDSSLARSKSFRPRSVDRSVDTWLGCCASLSSRHANSSLEPSTVFRSRRVDRSVHTWPGCRTSLRSRHANSSLERSTAFRSRCVDRSVDTWLLSNQPRTPPSLANPKRSPPGRNRKRSFGRRIAATPKSNQISSRSLRPSSVAHSAIVRRRRHSRNY